MIALHERDPEPAQGIALRRGLDTLGQNGDPEGAGDRDDARDDRVPSRIRIDAAHELHVDLDEIGPEIRQQVEPREAGAEIVEGRQEALLAIGGHDPLHMLDVLEPLLFGELEHDAPVGEVHAPCGLQRGADAGIRLVDRVRHEIDRQAGIAVARQEAPGQLDRLHARRLVELVARRVGDPVEDRAGRLAVGPAHQRLVGPDMSGSDIDDRLERHREVEIEGGTVATRATAFVLRHGAIPSVPPDQRIMRPSTQCNLNVKPSAFRRRDFGRTAP